MGFTQHAGLSFASATISLWVYIPSATVTAGIDAYEGWDNFPGFPNSGDLEQGIIPFLTFGARGQEYDGGADAGPMMPSVIGLSCREAWSGGGIVNPTLYARFQYATGGNPVGTGYQYPDYFQVGDLLHPAVSNNVDTIAEQFVEVAPDTWHHLLVSFDLSGSCSASFDSGPSFSTLPFYWALDGVNYKGNYLWPNTPAHHSVSGDDNGIVSNWCVGGPEGAEVTFTAGDLSGVFGIPGASSDSENVRNVIMAEIQIFTDALIDTGVDSNVRAFITSEGKPENPSVAAALMGKGPEVYFATLEDFQAGVNSGTAGNFVPTGTIDGYTPVPG